MQRLYVRYLASRLVEEIRCIAQARRRSRCTSPVLISDTPAGAWKLMAATGAGGQLALPAEAMAVCDPGRAPYAEQLRWRAQRCPQHVVTPAAADLVVADWELFDLLRHHEHVRTRLPDHARRPGPAVRARRAVRP
ncbi:hypothetical protein [Streptomyces mangrovisoli]|uniref:hypothetical protein n=1 Tax=Streptomyces mangrovisoli TaxID=1428628 RepID=UPI001F0A6370|nr:hypothetical protein [Streptomyces mangrovisoli]